MTSDQPPKGSLSDALAAERTFLAWIRTGLALMGFGFVVARFGLFLHQLQLLDHNPSPSYGTSLWLGTLLIAAGVVVNLTSAWHYHRLIQRLNSGGPVPPRPSTEAVLVAVFLALTGIAMAIYLIKTRSTTPKADSSSKLSWVMHSPPTNRQT